jgi:AAA+ ATPase superfamily predicted ATPase
VLFDPRPKEKRSDLFDRESELSELERFAEHGAPMVLCLGVRRVGKTSVVKVFVNEHEWPSVYIDARKLGERGYSKAGFYSILEESISSAKGGLARITEYLKGLKGVRLGELGVEFDLSGKGFSITSLLERLDERAGHRGETFLIVLDEAQELRFLKGYGKIDFVKVLAYSYDNLKNLKFVLTGSEVGLLYNFLGLENPKSPLYGRAYDKMVVERFSRERSVEFLEAGFAEAGVKVPQEVLERAVEVLDGIPGWLALYGYEVISRGVFDASVVLEKAIGVALTELRGIARQSELYGHILRAVALGYKQWGTLKRAVEVWLGRRVSDESLRRGLRKLTEVSILSRIEDEYEFLDPVYREAAKRL